MPINIYLGIKGWKWTGDELQASESFLRTSIIFSGKTKFFKYNNYITDRQLYADYYLPKEPLAGNGLVTSYMPRNVS